MRILIVVASLLVFSPRTNWSQTPPTPEQPWATRPVIQVWPGAAPGSEHDSRKEVMTVSPFSPDAHIVRNVSVPTLTVFQPKSGNSSGTAVLICPGGGFRMLSIDLEGYQVADWFAQHGVTAFVLKYRVAETPASDADFIPPNASMQEIMKRATAPLPQGQVAISISDGIQALKVVRRNASKYGFRADRVVALGFSAGGAVVIGAASAPNPSDRPNYVAPIYGAFLPEMSAPPKEAPPFFLAVADDDPLVGSMVFRLFTSLRDEGATPELHAYRSGSHGFSMRTLGTSDHWLQEMWWWMESFKLTTP
jgi:acetyl esterase/lipase